MESNVVLAFGRVMRERERGREREKQGESESVVCEVMGGRSDTQSGSRDDTCRQCTRKRTSEEGDVPTAGPCSSRSEWA